FGSLRVQPNAKAVASRRDVPSQDFMVFLSGKLNSEMGRETSKVSGDAGVMWKQGPILPFVVGRIGPCSIYQVIRSVMLRLSWSPCRIGRQSYQCWSSES